MKILIIGADGQLGTDLVKVIPQQEQIPLTIKDLDITQPDSVQKILSQHKPDIVINTAAFHDVDKCEDEVKTAFEVNTFGVKYLAQACQQIGSTLVHISTDYVFDGTKGQPYVESDCPNPQSVYAISKLAGEQMVRSYVDKYFIIRSTGLYGSAGCLGKGGTNFVEGMVKRAKEQLELTVVDDEVLSPTYTWDLAQKIYELVQTKKYGLYHLVNSGHCSWYDFTGEIFKLLNNPVKINRTKAELFKAKAKRPKFSALESVNLAKAGLTPMRPWPEALKAYLHENLHCS